MPEMEQNAPDPEYGFTVLGDDGVNPQDGQTPSDGDSIIVSIPCGCIMKDEPCEPEL